MEAYNYPFFATQFHPEKQQFVYYPTVKIDHSDESIEYSRYFADFFVHECRHNFNSFGSYSNEVAHLTETVGELVMMPTYTGLIYAF
jgi:gamma-glutamyl hydrolase